MKLLLENWRKYLNEEKYYHGGGKDFLPTRIGTFYSKDKAYAEKYAAQHKNGQVFEVEINLSQANVYPKVFWWKEFQEIWQPQQMFKGYDIVKVIEPNGTEPSIVVLNPKLVRNKFLKENLSRDTFKCPGPERGGFKGYYKIDRQNPPRLEDLLKCWVKNTMQVYDSNVNHSKPAFYPVKEIAPYREWRAEQLRNPLNSEEYKELKREIKKDGIKEPIIIQFGQNGKMKVGEGNHRHQIATELNIDKIPVRFNFFREVHLPGDEPETENTKEISSDEDYSDDDYENESDWDTKDEDSEEYSAEKLLDMLGLLEGTYK